MPDEKETATERAQLVRLYEASCKIEFPTADERNFRLALMKKVGVVFSLKEVRDKVIAGPETQSAIDPRTKAQGRPR